MKYFLLAAGQGQRVQPLSLEKAKPAFPLGGVPLIRIMLEQLKKKGCSQGYVNVHHLPESILSAIGKENCPIIFKEKQLSGSLVLRRSLPFGDDLLLVVNGDVYMDIPLQEMALTLASKEADGVLLVKKGAPEYSQLQISKGMFVGVLNRATSKSYNMYTGAALLTRRAVESIRDPNFIDSFVRSRIRLICVPYAGIWLDIGTPASYFRAVWEYHKQDGDEKLNILSPGVFISSDSRLTRSVIWENTIIGEASTLSECIVTANLTLTGIKAEQSLVTACGIFPLNK